MKNNIDYDAFVICNAEGTDLDFVNRLVDTLQAPPYKLKLCAPWRESVYFNQNARECIQYRCRKCMVVLSSNFYKSEEAVSQLQFAHSLSPGYKENKILPICLERCEVPKYLRLISKVDFCSTRSGGLEWEQLYRSLSSATRVPEQDKQKDSVPDIVKSFQI